MHRSEYDSGVVDFSLNVSGPIIPVHFQVLDGQGVIGVVALAVFRVEKLHDSCQIVWFARRFAYQVNVICPISADSAVGHDAHAIFQSDMTCGTHHSPLTPKTVPSSAFSFPSFKYPCEFSKVSIFVSRCRAEETMAFAFREPP